MIIDLTPQDIATLLESMEHSKQRVRETEGTPCNVKREILLRLDSAQQKLRLARDATAS